MRTLIKVFAIGMTIFLLSGCAKIFQKPGDQLVKSPCETVCKKAPFYINGRRVKS